jgi:uncharacterized protein (DUF2062 family)
MKLRRLLRYHWLILRRQQGDPRRLAWGMALGVFIGITPTIPFHTVMALTLAPLLRASVVAAVIGIQVGNPFTVVPIYLLAYQVGNYMVFSGEPLPIPDHFTLSACLELLWRGGLALQVGGVIIALPPAVLSYFLTLWAIRRVRRRRAREIPGNRVLPPDGSAASRPEA